MKAQLIAELCQNHNGDLSLLKEMVWAAKESGADIVKIQSMNSADLTHRTEFDSGADENGKVRVIKRPYEPELERLAKLDLTEDAQHLFVEECHKAGVTPSTTIFSRSRIPFVASLGLDTIKVASYDCASFPMIRELAQRFKHLIISTGATYTAEIERTAQMLEGHSFALLHCVTRYPTPLEHLNLKRMNFLKNFSSTVGFSDHSSPDKTGLKASFAALAMGASHIERHFTILRPDQSKDGPVSVNAKQMKELRAFADQSEADRLSFCEQEIPEWQAMQGEEDTALSHEELLNRAYYRGRFASKDGKDTIYNWEDRVVFA